MQVMLVTFYFARLDYYAYLYGIK